MSKFRQSMPENLQEIIKKAESLESGNRDTAIQSIHNMDITSLKEGDIAMIGIESEEEIKKLCDAAQKHDFEYTAAICVYPNQIANVKTCLGDNHSIKIAVVNNFPHGDLSAKEAEDSAFEAILAGADEIDTVIDYEAFMNGDIETVVEKLKAVRKTCLRSNVKLKTILKASIYADYDDLYDAASLAIECGCDFVKTCTGKLPKEEFSDGTLDASTLKSAATVMQAIADSGSKSVGVKISGGVKTAVDCERMRYLSDNILGKNYFIDNKKFRFGASSLMSNLEAFLKDKASPENTDTKSY